MCGHGSARAERVCSGVFWGASESSRSHLLVLRPDDGDDVIGADQAGTLSGRVVFDWGGWVASMFSQAE